MLWEEETSKTLLANKLIDDLCKYYRFDPDDFFYNSNTKKVCFTGEFFGDDAWGPTAIEEALYSAECLTPFSEDEKFVVRHYFRNVRMKYIGLGDDVGVYFDTVSAENNNGCFLTLEDVPGLEEKFEAAVEKWYDSMVERFSEKFQDLEGGDDY